MSAPPPPPALADRPLPGRDLLTRDLIISTATSLIDVHGVAALTMRRLGAELGVQAMALYRYVPSRDDLIAGVLEAVMAQLKDDPEVHPEARDGWVDYLQRLAHGIRRIALAHPAVFPLMATHPHDPWLRPPLLARRWTSSFLAALTAHGFTPRQAVKAYRAYTGFLIGHLLLEVAQCGVVPPDVPDIGYPLSQLRPLLLQLGTTADFEESLQFLIARLAAWPKVPRLAAAFGWPDNSLPPCAQDNDNTHR